MPVTFSFKSRRFIPKNSAAIKKWITAVIAKEKRKTGKVIYIFCTDAELLDINLEFLNHNTLTDIITFDYSEGDTVSGEIYISLDRVKENADKFGVDFETELRRVMIHGVLHLCGYGDKTMKERNAMRVRENRCLALLEEG